MTAATRLPDRFHRSSDAPRLPPFYSAVPQLSRHRFDARLYAFAPPSDSSCKIRNVGRDAPRLVFGERLDATAFDPTRPRSVHGSSLRYFRDGQRWKRSQLKARHHRQVLDLLLFEGLEEGVVVAERDAAARVPIGAKHVGVGQKATAAEHAGLVHGYQPDRFHAVEQGLARFQVIDIDRRGALHAFVGVTRIVEHAAAARMRFQYATVRQINLVC